MKLKRKAQCYKQKDRSCRYCCGFGAGGLEWSNGIDPNIEKNGYQTQKKAFERILGHRRYVY